MLAVSALFLAVTVADRSLRRIGTGGADETAAAGRTDPPPDSKDAR